MAGLSGFVHRCNDSKVNIIPYSSSLKDSGFSDEALTVLWDFYVSRSFAASTGNPISLEKCGWHDTQSKTEGCPALEKELVSNAGFISFAVIRSKTIKDTLAQMDLNNEHICVSHPRAVFMQNFSYESDENVRIKSMESRIHALFRHIRNSLAHGNTCFFPNNNCLLIDKDGTKVTAAILLPKQALWDWISIVDKNKKYYDCSHSPEWWLSKSGQVAQKYAVMARC